MALRSLKVFPEARIAVGAEMVGIMDVPRDKTVEYSRTRNNLVLLLALFRRYSIGW